MVIPSSLPHRYHQLFALKEFANLGIAVAVGCKAELLDRRLDAVEDIGSKVADPSGMGTQCSGPKVRVLNRAEMLLSKRQACWE